VIQRKRWSLLDELLTVPIRSLVGRCCAATSGRRVRRGRAGISETSRYGRRRVGGASADRRS